MTGVVSPLPEPAETAPRAHATGRPRHRRARSWRPRRRRARPPTLGAAYHRVWTASTISTLGDGVRFTAMPLLAATITRDPRVVALVTVAGFLPWLLFSLVAGALVDRWDRRRVMWVADLFRTAVVGSLTVLVAVGGASIAAIVVTTFLLGTAETMFDNASQSILPALVGRDRLTRANGNLYTGQIVSSQFVGPPLGGVLFAAFAALPFLVDSASFLTPALLVMTLRGSFREPRDEATPRTRLAAEISEGVRWLARHRVLRALAGMLGMWNLVTTATEAVLVLWALEVLHLGPRGYGLLGLGFAVGSLVGSRVAVRAGQILAEGPTLYATIGLAVVANLTAFATTNAVVAGGAFVLVGFASVVWNVHTVSLRQEIIPPRLLGRVNSAYRFIGWGSMPLGAAVGGFVAHAFGLRAPFLFAAVVTVVCGALMARAVTTATIRAARAQARAQPGQPASRDSAAAHAR